MKFRIIASLLIVAVTLVLAWMFGVGGGDDAPAARRSSGPSFNVDGLGGR